MEEATEAPVATEAVEEKPVETKKEEVIVEEKPVEEPKRPPPKPKGHRLKDPNKEILTDKINCEDCNQTM